MRSKLSLTGVGAARPLAVFALLLLGIVVPQAWAQSSLDFGDAPNPYPTLLSSNGPRHTATGPSLGAGRDTENNGLPDPLALGDDNTATDDEDGISFLSALVPGQAATIQVSVSGAPNGARLDAWIDFDGDGSWSQTIDRIFTSRFLPSGVSNLTFTVPAGSKVGATFARFRLTFEGISTFTGAASNGEVEDYRVGITEAMDFGDAPISVGTAGGFNYPTLLSQNGARHRVVQNFMLGARVDTEPDGQPNATATGDDINPTAADDEDGITFTGSLVAGATATVNVVCTMGATTTGRLNAWMDFNRDGDWNDAGEQIFTDFTVRNGGTNINFAIPGSAEGGITFTRFRLSVNGKIGPTGFAADGEVEDHQVTVTSALDYGDAPAPYPTLLNANGARHTFSRTFALGTYVDGEIDGQPEPSAKGDDNSPAGVPDDEDGVNFTSSITPAQVASVEVFVTAPAGSNGGLLNAWLDFNRDGDWADQGEQIFLDRPVIPGVNNLTFTVPGTASQGPSFARFRLSTARSLGFTGATADGEVEDHQVNISSGPLDFGDAPKPYPTLLAENGARHVYSSDVFLGFRVDPELDGQPDASATGDDLSGPDEDGVVFTSPLVPGALVNVQVRASVVGLLHAWIDFNRNGSWADPGEKIFNGSGLASGVNNLSFTVPASAVQGITFARFRFTQQTAILDFTGAGPIGEVEDYRVSIVPDRERCDLDCHGREFWLTFPGNYAPDPDNPARLSLCINGNAGTAVSITAPGVGFSTNVVVPATQTVTVQLPRILELSNIVDVVTNRGIHVVASAPIGIQGFNHARYTTDSFLALNSSVIGTDYIVQGFGNLHVGVPPLNGTQFAIVASESNTLVAIIPTVEAAGRPANVPYLIVLQPGDAYQLRSTNDAPADLSGTIIKSSKPIAVFGGNRCANVPSDDEWYCDYLVEQLLPVNTWGNDFFTAPLATRSSGDTFRLMAAYDATDIFLNGALVGTVDRGKFLQGPIAVGSRITSSRPISVMQYATSGDHDGNTNADPFMLTVQGVRHYSSAYRVCAPTNDFPTNYVNIIGPSGSMGTIQVDGVAIPGPFTAIGASGYSYARVLVAPGSHRVHSTTGARFACYIYGWAEFDSYGHPACFYFGDVEPPRITGAPTTAAASVEDYPNTPGLVPTPDFASVATVQDNCDPQTPPRPNQTPRPTTLLPPGVHTVSLSAQDNNGNLGETTVTFTVTDSSPVIIDCPREIVVNCVSNNGAVVEFTVTAHTTYDPMVPVVSDPPSGSFFPAGTTTVTSTAVSTAGQSNVCTFKVTVVCDNKLQATTDGTNLMLTWPAEGTLEATTELGTGWQEVPNARSPYNAPLTGPQRFFRVRF